jgi:hypothetical protein
MRYRTLLVAIMSVGLALVGWAEDVKTTSRVFHLRHATVNDASQAVQPLLSEHGSLTVQPSKARITVQDSPEVVAQVAEVLADLDRSPDNYTIEVVLLLGTNDSLDAELRTTVNSRVEKMFPFAGYRTIASTVFEGEMGSQAAADLGEGYRLSFLPTIFNPAEDFPFGVRGGNTRIQLQALQLVRITEGRDGSRTEVDVLRTTVRISPQQEAYIGAGASEESSTGLVLILRAGSLGEQ